MNLLNSTMYSHKELIIRINFYLIHYFNKIILFFYASLSLYKVAFQIS